MKTTSTLITAGAGIAAAAGLAITAASLANADSQLQNGAAPAAYGQASPGQGQQGPGPDGQGRGGHSHTAISGETKSKVEAAAKAKVPGATVQESRQDPDGTYDVVLTKSDGSRVMVEVSKTFVATVHTQGPGGPGGPGGKHTPLTGTTKTKVEAAAKAKVPGTVVHSHQEQDGTYDVLVTKADGSVVKVRVGKDFAVTGVETAPQRGGRGGPAEQGRQGSGTQTTPQGYGANQLPTLPGEAASASAATYAA